METISMSRRERRRLEVFSRVAEGSLKLTTASDLLQISLRQASRLFARYQEEGDAGLVHGLRGRPSNRSRDVAFREQVLSRYRESYADYGPTLAAEELAKEGLTVAVETLRRWLRGARLWEVKKRRQRHRRRRERKEHRGELLQMDGSHHDWFEGRRREAVLMVAIDDATGFVNARFFEEETQEASFEMMHRYAREHGLPRALYVDGAGIYRPEREATPNEILAGTEPMTEFGRAMQELGVRLILAHSPQAKGRVERMNGTLQDRLVKALRQRGISNLETANQFLEQEFLPEFNRRFAIRPKQPADLHRAVSAKEDLWRILAVQEERVVQNDWTLRWRTGILQLQPSNGVQPKDRVTVCDQRDGRLRVFLGERELAWSATRTTAQRSPPRRKRQGMTRSSQGQKPVVRHPWRRAIGGGTGATAGGAACSTSARKLASVAHAAPRPK